MVFRSDSKKANEILSKEKVDLDVPLGKVKDGLASELTFDGGVGRPR